MDELATHWQLRARQRLEEEGVGYRGLARRLQMDYSTIQRQLAGRGAQKNESLWFVRQLASGMNWSLTWLLFGGESSDESGSDLRGKVLPVPWLSDEGVTHWLDADCTSFLPKWVQGWFGPPSMMSASGDRLFVWHLASDELSDLGYPAQSWLYVDPHRRVLVADDTQPEGYLMLEREAQVLVLCRLKKTDQLLVKRLEQVAGELWFLPGNHYYTPHRLTEVTVVGRIVGGTQVLTRV